jgi:hypothetical protein
MSPRHFANYAKQYPKQYQAFSDNMWNGFVSITHTIGLNRFFSFVPAEFEQVSEDLNASKIGRELGKVYKQSDTKPL